MLKMKIYFILISRLNSNRVWCLCRAKVIYHLRNQPQFKCKYASMVERQCAIVLTLEYCSEFLLCNVHAGWLAGLFNLCVASVNCKLNNELLHGWPYRISLPYFFRYSSSLPAIQFVFYLNSVFNRSCHNQHKYVYYYIHVLLLSMATHCCNEN